MNQAPNISTITEWLENKGPLGINGPFAVTDTDPKPWSGHFNYLVTSADKRFVLRFRGPEWGEPEDLRAEYKILREVESYAVGPKVFGLAEDFFGETAVFMEYLEGELLGSLNNDEQELRYGEVIKLVASINKIPHQKLAIQDLEAITRYDVHKSRWRERLKVIENGRRSKEWAKKITALLPSAEGMLDRFQPRLDKTLEESGSMFIFTSAHVGHCFVTRSGLRFINWEHVGLGDPSYTLAVFLASIDSRPDFESVKKELTQQYLKIIPVPEFAELLEQRLAERCVSNLIWVLWAYAQRQDNKPPEEATSVLKHYQKTLEVLKRFG